MYPVTSGGTPIRKKSGPHAARKVRRVRRLVRQGASNRQITRATRKAVRAVNTAQRQGTLSQGAVRQVRKTRTALRADNSLYSKRSANTIRRAVKRRPHPNQDHPQRKRNYPIAKQGDIGPPKKKTPDKPKVRHPSTPSGPSSPGKPRNVGPPVSHGPSRGPGSPGKPRAHRPKNKGPHKGKGNGPKKHQPKDVKLGKPGRKLARRIENVTEKRYFRSSERLAKKQVAKFRKRRKYIVKHTKGKKKEQRKIKIARKNLMKDVRERGTAAPKLYRKAGLAVSAELDPQLKALKSRINQTKRDRGRTLKDLRGIYKTANQQHQDLSQRITDSSNRTIEGTKEDFDSLLNRISNTYDSSKESVLAELNRLGLQGAGAASTEGLDRDKQYAKSLAQTSQAEAGAEGRTDREGYQQLMGLLGGEMQAQGLAARTEARQKFTDEIMSLRDQKSALAATRLGKIVTAVEALRQARSAAQAEKAQTRLANLMAQKEFNLDVAKFKADVRDTRTDNRLNQLKYDLDKAKFLTDQMRKNRPKKAPKIRTYSNSRAGAIDYLKDRGAPGQLIDRYLSFAASGTKATYVQGPFGIPIPIPHNLTRNDNAKVSFMVRQMIKKGMPRDTARFFGNALRVEWGLV